MLRKRTIGIPTLKAIAARSTIDHRGCWLWNGKLRKDGYARLCPGSRGSPEIQVHRLAWELKNEKPMRKGKIACHKCYVKHCVNPDHIYEGTDSQNVRDRFRAPRIPA